MNDKKSDLEQMVRKILGLYSKTVKKRMFDKRLEMNDTIGHSLGMPSILFIYKRLMLIHLCNF